MKVFLISWFVLFFGPLTFAHDLKWTVPGQGKTDYYVGFSEKDQWVLQIYQVRPGQMQELVERRSFSTLSALKHEMDQRLSQVSLLSRWSSTLQPRSTEVPGSTLWDATEAWNSDWEKQFHHWVEQEFGVDFFTRYNIATDCADAATLLRWIFAREHKLPMGNTLAGTGALFTHESMRKKWLRLPTDPVWHQDQRFRAVLDYLADTTYTHTLYQDSYPLELKSLHPGAFHLLKSGYSGHTRIIGKVDLSPEAIIPMTLYWSTVPREVRDLGVEPFLDSMAPTPQMGGFRNIRWLVGKAHKWRLKRAEDHPHYSMEQYGEELSDNFALRVYQRLVPGFDPRKTLGVAIQEVIHHIELRIPVVIEGHEICQIMDCSPGTPLWEDWSTPSRDKRLLEKVDAVENLIIQYSQILDPQEWQKAQEETFFEVDLEQLSLKQVIQIWRGHLYSSDPRVSLERRWALTLQAVHANVKVQFDQWISERQLKVKSATQSLCGKAQCDFHSTDFDKGQSFELDEKFRSSAAAYLNYCWMRSETQGCQGQSRFEPAQFQVLGRTVTLDDLIDRVPWFVADPNVSPEIRWAVQPKPFRWQILPSSVAKYGQRVDENGFIKVSDKLYLNVQTGEKLRLPKGCSEVRHWEGTQKYLCLSPAETGSMAALHVYDVLNGEWTNHSLTSSTSENLNLILLPKNHISVMDGVGGKIQIYRWAEEHLLPIKSYEGSAPSMPMPPHSGPLNHLVIRSSTGYTIVGVNEQGLWDLTLSSDSNDNLFSEVWAETKDWLLLSGFETRGEALLSVSYFVNKRTGQIEAIHPPGYFVEAVYPDLDLFAVRSADAQELILYKGLNPHRMEVIKKYSQAWSTLTRHRETLYISWSENNDLRIRTVDRYMHSQWERFKAQPPGVPAFVTHDWVHLFFPLESRFDLVQFDGTKTISAPRSGNFDVCGGNLSDSFFCQGINSHYFWLNVQIDGNRTESGRSQSWQVFHDFHSGGISDPLLTRTQEFVSDAINTSALISPKVEQGTIVPWARGSYLWVE